MTRVQTLSTSAADGAADALHEATLTELAHALEADLRSGAACEPALEQALLGAIHSSLARAHNAAQPATARAALSQRTLRKVEDFIHANLATQFSIDDIGRAACLSIYHLGRAWHQTTGQSLWQYVLQCRVALACSLIRHDPQAQLGDIAVQSGFECYSQFIAVFRKLHGVTPGAWRRMLH